MDEYYILNIVYKLLQLATDWTVRVSNPGGGESFRTRPDGPWDPSCPVYNGYRVSFPG